MPLVSVIIPTFNRSQKLLRAVESVISQHYKGLEILVIDDASTDTTYKDLLKFGKSITYIRLNKNTGVSGARNTGIHNATAPWIAFLDSDDCWLKDKLRIQMLFIKDNPETIACQTDEIWIRNGRRVNPKIKHKKPSGNIFNQSLKLCLVSPSSVIIKSSVFNEIGIFDESLPAAEDYDLWLRISCRYPIYLIDKKLIVKEGGHHDQLSKKFHAMDRFRIASITKLIQSGVLSLEQKTAALKELKRKCSIYAHGCLKRGKTQEAAFYLALPDTLENFLQHQVDNAPQSFS
jgi:glycosyltransferase involved in cell wall biosynthesis